LLVYDVYCLLEKRNGLADLPFRLSQATGLLFNLADLPLSNSAGLLRASVLNSAFQKFHQILVKLLKSASASSSPSFHQNTSLSESFSRFNAQNLHTILFFFSHSHAFLHLLPTRSLCQFPPARSLSLSSASSHQRKEGSKPLIFQALGQLTQATRWVLDGRG